MNDERRAKPTKAQRLVLERLADGGYLTSGRAGKYSPRLREPEGGRIALVPRQTYERLLHNDWLRPWRYRFGWEWKISNQGRAAIGLEPSGEPQWG
jgi:hypothetical protein